MTKSWSDEAFGSRSFAASRFCAIDSPESIAEDASSKPICNTKTVLRDAATGSVSSVTISLCLNGST